MQANPSALNNLFNRLFGSKKTVETELVNEPSSRYIDLSSSSNSIILGRDCVPGDVYIDDTATPEAAGIQYCRA